jgi:hypothetical protein
MVYPPTEPVCGAAVVVGTGVGVFAIRVVTGCTVVGMIAFTALVTVLVAPVATDFTALIVPETAPATPPLDAPEVPGLAVPGVFGVLLLA